MSEGPATAMDRVRSWFLGPLPIDSLVLARMIFGAVLFFCYLGRFPDVQLLFGPHGLAGPDWIHPDRLHASWVHAVATALPEPTEARIWFLYGLELVCALCFAIGFRTRSAGAVALLVHLVFLRLRLPSGYWGWSIQIIPLVLFVVFSRAGHFVSIDAWLARRSGRAAPDASQWVGAAWPLRLIQLHTASMYLVSGGERIDDLGWLEGAAIWYAMSDVMYSKWAYNWHDFRLPMSLGTWYTFAFEPFSAFMLWFRWIGPITAYMAIAMHVGLEMLTNVGWWNFVMTAGLLTFLPASHVRALVARLPGGQAVRLQRS